MSKKPKIIDALWGVWIPDYGCWMQSDSEMDNGTLAFETRDEAERQSKYDAAEFPGCFAAPMTTAAKVTDAGGVWKQDP